MEMSKTGGGPAWKGGSFSKKQAQLMPIAKGKPTGEGRGDGL